MALLFVSSQKGDKIQDQSEFLDLSLIHFANKIISIIAVILYKYLLVKNHTR